MNDLHVIINELPAYKGEYHKIRTRQSIRDIQGDLLYKHEKNAKDCLAIAKHFWRGNAYDTAQYLFDFCKQHIAYKIEGTYGQSVKTISAILTQGRGDCKHYAQFIVGICSALRAQGYPIKAKYRFAIYDAPSSISDVGDTVRTGHVFAVIMHKGREIWCDPVLKNFDQRTPRYISFQDKIPPTMAAERIGEVWDVSGFGNSSTLSGMKNGTTLSGMRNGTTLSGGMTITRDERGTLMEQSNISGLGWLDEHFNRAPSVIGKHKAKKPHKKHKFHLKLQPGKFFKKIALAPNRNAFLLYLKLNLFHTGSKFYDKVQHNKQAHDKLYGLWKKIGGNTNKLTTALFQAHKVWNKHHAAHKINGYAGDMMNGDAHLMDGHDDNIGVVQLAVPAVIAAAAPIIKMFSGLLKSFGIGHPGDKDVADADQQAAADHNNATDEDGDGNKDIQADGSVHHGHGVTSKVSVDPATGKQTISYDVPDDAGDDDGGDGGGGGVTKSKTKTKTTTKEDVDTDGDGDADEEVTTKTKSVSKYGDGGSKDGYNPPTGIAAFWEKGKNFFVEHKTPIMVTGAVVLGIIIIPKVYRAVTGAKPRRRK